MGHGRWESAVVMVMDTGQWTVVEYALHGYAVMVMVCGHAIIKWNFPDPSQTRDAF